MQVNAATQAEDEAAYARFFTARALAEGGVDLLTYKPPRRDLIVVVERQQKRRWANVGEVVDVANILAAPMNYTVQMVSFEGKPDHEIAQLMQRAAMMIALHGAGMTNLMFMQRGSAVLEVTPPSNPETTMFFGALARNMGLHHGTVVAVSEGGRTPGFDDSMHILPRALRAMGDVLLSQVDGRTPT